MQIDTDDLDQEQMASVLEDIAKVLREDDVEDKQLMDGSIRIETSHGIVFLTVEYEI